jgi:hypothetical protein
LGEEAAAEADASQMPRVFGISPVLPDKMIEEVRQDVAAESAAMEHFDPI